jgi:ornithine--oxo-acid transaminase
MHPIIALETQHCAHNYSPLPVVLTRGEGCYLWDDAGKRYLDMMSAYSAVSFGHNHPRILAALIEQAGRLAVTSRAYHSDQLAPLARDLCRMTGMDAMLPMNTGAEAVETAIKGARKWAYTVKGVPADQAEIIVCDWNFHGRTSTIVSFSSHSQYRDLFGPHPAGFKRVPYGDAAALASAITPNTAAFLVEPVQGEAGIVPPPPGYLKACQEICRANNVLLIADEVQTGLGRTGKVLACEHDGVSPDGLILGKALGGGVLAISALLGKKHFMDVWQPGDHGSTFGGNALACRVAREAIAVLREERLSERAAQLGQHLTQSLVALRHPAIEAVRGLGLLVGVVLDRSRASAHEIALRLAEAGMLSKDTHGNVIRLAPPLTVSREQIDWAVGTLAAVLDDVAGLPRQRAA